VLPTLQKRGVHWKHILRIPKLARSTLTGFQKALNAALRNMLSNNSKRFELAGFQKLRANYKAFSTK
jgi:hypothetical protein